MATSTGVGNETEDKIRHFGNRSLRPVAQMILADGLYLKQHEQWVKNQASQKAKNRAFKTALDSDVKNFIKSTITTFDVSNSLIWIICHKITDKISYRKPQINIWTH
jgi:hypothetical protein